jgi:hypothetical protein
MTAPHRLKRSSADDLAWEGRQERRRELVGAGVRVMAGSSRVHNDLALNLRQALKERW